MSPRAFAVTTATASAAWLALFLTGCSGGAEDSAKPATEVAESTTAGAISIRYVTHRVQPDTDYKRISEYFTGEENTGGDIVSRTDPADRRGLWFIAALDYFDGLPEGAVATLEFVGADKAEPVKHLFVLPPQPNAGLFKEIKLGVTGKDWPKTNPKIIAWKLTLRDKKTGARLASAHSFLWEMPEKKTEAAR